MTTENKNMEQHIIDVAKQVFTKKGFVETSMSDIATAAGINRSGLHYYFRTKDRMFEAVFADIISKFVPAIHNIITQNISVGERIEQIINIYFNSMQQNPSLPMFMLREIQRDPAHIIATMKESPAQEIAKQIRDILLKEMACGNIKFVPIEQLIYTLYSAVLFPFLIKPLTNELKLTSDETFAATIQQWKEQVIKQINTLLSVTA